MAHIKRLFFIPVGLPGMGKSTLSKHIKMAVERNLAHGLIKTHLNNASTVSYHKVSYDRILGENLSAYSEKHPEVPFHEVIDIIRGKADQDYLD
jgi:tRNA uridine 5-carbamoylmethylation protein Kti12